MYRDELFTAKAEKVGVVVKHVRTTKTITSLALLSRTVPMEDMHLPPGPSYPDLLWLT